MCGIAGFLDRRLGAGAPSSADAWTERARRMGDALRHRGPDAGGAWVDPEGGVALAHRRLSILDLSPAGAQPMASSSGRFVLSYNGEIYNYEELREDLRAEGHAVHGASDTAVLLVALEVWGVARTLPRLAGMFAFALWDRTERRLALARDRLGIKPLVYAGRDGLLLFGSELGALRAHPEGPRALDPRALNDYLRHGNVGGARCILAGARKLPPAHWLEVGSSGEPVLHRYWDAAEAARKGRAQGHEADPAALHDLLAKVVRQQMMSDVPLGALLSGGVDSSVVTALMQAASPRPIRTFTIGFSVRDLNEAPAARAIALHLGTDHTETVVTGADALERVPRLMDIYDEPFADSSQLPTWLVAESARRHVTVALSGDGGDEMFLGYNRYLAWDRLHRLPAAARKVLGAFARQAPAPLLNRLGAFLPRRFRVPQLGDKLAKLGLMADQEVGAAWHKLTSWWQNPEDLTGLSETPDDPRLLRTLDDPLAQMQLWDLQTYLPDDVLTKMDRASMAVALEARVPLLDDRVVDFALRLAPAACLRNGVGKKPLRAIAARYIPEALLDRPKSGFAVPLESWLRGPLRDWAAALLTPARIESCGLRPAPVLAVWRQHQEGAANRAHELWAVLMLLDWARRL